MGICTRIVLVQVLWVIGPYTRVRMLEITIAGGKACAGTRRFSPKHLMPVNLIAS